MNDALKIGYIREALQTLKDVNNKEKNILLASLIYSLDKSANTVGHYDAYIKGKVIKDSFEYDLVEPINIYDCNVHISREDANEYAKRYIVILYILILRIIRVSIADSIMC